VQLSIAAANRDPARFRDPDRFDAARDPRGVLSFGHGPHDCLGAHQAREQSRIAPEVLFDRLGTAFRLDDRAGGQAGATSSVEVECRADRVAELGFLVVEQPADLVAQSANRNRRDVVTGRDASAREAVCGAELDFG
jgi:hypothetical protein